MKSEILEQFINLHPYYANETNYYVGGDNNHGQIRHEDFQCFIDEWADADMNYNTVFRWDINHAYDDNDDFTHYQLQVTMILQRKGIYRPVFVENFTEEDLQPFLEWVAPRLEYMQQLWILPTEYSYESSKD